MTACLAPKPLTRNPTAGSVHTAGPSAHAAEKASLQARRGHTPSTHALSPQVVTPRGRRPWSRSHRGPDTVGAARVTVGGGAQTAFPLSPGKALTVAAVSLSDPPSPRLHTKALAVDCLCVPVSANLLCPFRNVLPKANTGAQGVPQPSVAAGSSGLRLKERTSVVCLGCRQLHAMGEAVGGGEGEARVPPPRPADSAPRDLRRSPLPARDPACLDCKATHRTHRRR